MGWLRGHLPSCETGERYPRGARQPEVGVGDKGICEWCLHIGIEGFAFFTENSRSPLNICSVLCEPSSWLRLWCVMSSQQSQEMGGNSPHFARKVVGSVITV